MKVYVVLGKFVPHFIGSSLSIAQQWCATQLDSYDQFRLKWMETSSGVWRGDLGDYATQQGIFEIIEYEIDAKRNA